MWDWTFLWVQFVVIRVTLQTSRCYNFQKATAPNFHPISTTLDGNCGNWGGGGVLLFMQRSSRTSRPVGLLFSNTPACAFSSLMPCQTCCPRIHHIIVHIYLYHWFNVGVALGLSIAHHSYSVHNYSWETLGTFK